MSRHYVPPSIHTIASSVTVLLRVLHCHRIVNLRGKYSIAILRIEADLASVIRILDTRTDYIRTIFGD